MTSDRSPPGDGSPPGTPDPAAWTGRRLGRLRVGRLLGSGGMGEVYEGWDEVLERRVAIKTIRSAFTLSEPTKERFLREARLLSRLDHPNICRLHDLLSLPEGDVLVLELVEGRPLGRLAPGELSPRERLRIAHQIALALAAAHREGIVHRDLKPDNVMLRPDGGVKVLDFGIARAAAGGEEAGTDPASPGDVRPVLPTASHEGLAAASAAGQEAPTLALDTVAAVTAPTELTSRGSIVGTLRFMSPEQAAGHPVTVASDLYSLGLVIHWLWTGRSAYDESLGWMALLERIREAAAEPLASGDPELDRLVERLKRRAPEERPSAEEAAATLAWIAGREERRRRRWRLAAAAAAVALAAGLTSFVVADRWQERRAGLCRGGDTLIAEVWAPQRRAAIERAFAATGAPFAVPAMQAVGRAVDAWSAEWAATRRGACEATHLRREQSAELLDLRMACLDRRLTHLDSLLEVFAGADAAVVERAVKAVADLGDLAVCADRETLLAATPRPTDPELLRRLVAAETVVARGEALLDAGRYDQALEAAGEAITLAAPLAYRPLEAEAWRLKGAAEGWLGRPEEARESLQRAVEAAVAGGHEVALVRALADQVWTVGYDLADLAAAEAWAGIALAQLEPMAAGGELVAMVHNNLGAALMAAWQWEAAREHVERAHELRRATFGDRHVKTAGSLGNLANLAYFQGRWGDSVELNRRALAIYERELGAEHPDLASLYGNLGAAYYAQEAYAEAAAANERALAIAETVFGADSPNVGHPLVNLGNVDLEQQRWEQAEARYRRARALWEPAYPADHPIFALTDSGLARALRGQGRTREAIPLFEHALALLATGGGSAVERGALELHLAQALWDSGGSRSRARDLARTAHTRLADHPGPLATEAAEWLAARGE